MKFIAMTLLGHIGNWFQDNHQETVLWICSAVLWVFSGNIMMDSIEFLFKALSLCSVTAAFILQLIKIKNERKKARNTINKNSLSKMIKKILKQIQLWDWIWSIPIGVTIFVLAGYFNEWFFGSPFYDSQYLHKSILAGIILLIANGFIMGFMWFNHRVHFKHYYNSNLDYKHLPHWLKIYSYPVIYFLELLAYIAIFKAI